MSINSPSSPTLGTLEAWAANKLQACDLPGARRDVQLLLMEAAGLSKAQLIARREQACEPSVVEQFVDWIERRARAEPVFRIIGRRLFHGLDLGLNGATLEPRDDSEALVDLVLAQISDRSQGYKFLDLGTGTGAIALALLSELPNARVLASDVDADALHMAQENALQNGFADRFEPIQSDWYAAIEGRFDFIVSNPPYIASHHVDQLHDSVRLYDPPIALDGGPDGLDAYSAILSGAAARLSDRGFVAVETGFDQRESLRQLARELGWCHQQDRTDLGGNHRAMLFAKSVPEFQ